jgi:hypothetical protein
MKKSILLSLSIAVLIAVVSFSALGLNSQSFTSLACDSEGGVVDKTPSEAFKVKIVFKNTGKTEGTWSVNVAFEGESWTWSGTPQTLLLKPGKTKILAWNGTVPLDAPIDSVVRLVVYYNDSFTALDWWIHVVPGAELAITSSSVE